MRNYFGTYSLSGGSGPQECSVLVFDKTMSIGYRSSEGRNFTIQWDVKDVEAYYDLSSQQTRITNNKRYAEQLVIEGKEAADFIHAAQAELLKPWHRKKGAKEWRRSLLLLAGIIGLFIAAYLLLVPWLSEKLASRVSVETEQQLGETVYQAMGLKQREDETGSLLVNEFFAAMNVNTPYSIKITVVYEDEVNAFALPGGRMVVYSGLLNRIKSYPELAALLSHEFTHINSRHSTRSVFRRLGSKIFISVLFGRFGTVASVLADNADNLKSLRYSRGLEKEADMEGLQLLLDRKIDPEGFADLFQHLQQPVSKNSLPEFLASHPDIDSRAAYIKEASKKASVEEDTRLKAIFDKIKK